MAKFNDIEDLKNRDVFKVPEGYFDTLTQRVMANIPADTAKVVSINAGGNAAAAKGGASRRLWMRAVAACAACVLTVGVATHFFTQNGNDGSVAITETSADSFFSDDMEYGEELINYSLVGSDEIYCYLAGSEY